MPHPPEIYRYLFGKAVMTVSLIDIILIILILAWLGGFSFHVGGSLIHLLLVVVLIVVVLRLLGVGI